MYFRRWTHQVNDIKGRVKEAAAAHERERNASHELKHFSWDFKGRVAVGCDGGATVKMLLFYDGVAALVLSDRVSRNS